MLVHGLQKNSQTQGLDMDCLPHFPDILPCPLLNGYGYSPKNSFTRTQMDSGRARHRRRFKTIAEHVNVTWIMNHKQLSIFEGFFNFETCSGAGWFVAGLGNGFGIRCVRARFTNPEAAYQVSRISGALWNISAVLETFEMPGYDIDTYALLKDNSIEDLTLLENALYAVVHTAPDSPYYW